jgi:hypothetical protein
MRASEKIVLSCSRHDDDEGGCDVGCRATTSGAPTRASRPGTTYDTIALSAQHRFRRGLFIQGGVDRQTNFFLTSGATFNRVIAAFNPRTLQLGLRVTF